MLELREVGKEYPSPRGTLPILAKISLILQIGEAAVITGPSGSGKSTLLYLMGALEPPTSGQIFLEGQDPFQLSENDLAAFRNQKIGFVFQDHCLLPQCTVLENVLTPTLIGPPDNHFEKRAHALLEQVGLSERLEHLPSQLSGGEKQRVALARALIRAPRLVLCDEPTGNLDHRSAHRVADLLIELHRREQTILVVVTHSLELAARFEKRYELVEGSLKEY